MDVDTYRWHAPRWPDDDAGHGQPYPIACGDPCARAPRGAGRRLGGRRPRTRIRRRDPRPGGVRVARGRLLPRSARRAGARRTARHRRRVHRLRRRQPEPEVVLLQQRRSRTVRRRRARVRLGGRRRRHHDLERLRGLAGALSRQVQRRPQHDRRSLGVARRRLRGDPHATGVDGRRRAASRSELPSRAMRAIQQTEFGGPEVLKLVDIPRPEPADGELLIRVTRAGLNYADTHNRENTYLAPASLPQVPGGEVAGVREDTGERVVALCGSGGYAEYATANERLAFAIPDGVDDGTALALIVQGLTAWHLFRTSARLAEGESVVVQAAAGGVASTQEKRALALELGADVAIPADPDGMGERIVEANGGRKVDVVLEMSGGEVFEQSLSALAPFGRLAVFGAASGTTNKVETGRLMAGSRAVIGFWLIHCITRPGMLAEPLAELFERVGRGELRAIVGETYPLGEITRAHADMQARRTSGKLLLDPSA